MNYIEKVISKVLRTIRMDFLLLFFGKRSYLNKTGWLSSSIKKKCIDSESNPIPWWSYPAIKFIENRIKPDMDVFEFGAGYSTLWLSKKVRSVISVENNFEWYSLLKNQQTDNVQFVYSAFDLNKEYGEITFLPLSKTNNNYSNEIKQFDKFYDIIIIDGVDRNNCIKESLNYLKDGGVIIVDNLELKELMQDAIELIYDSGFKLLDFWGLSAGIAHETGTGIFYKKNNCLDI